MLEGFHSAKLVKDGQLSKKEYGYIVAHIDLGLAAVKQCSLNNLIN